MALAQALPEEERTATLGAVLALTYTQIDPALAERLQEDPLMTSVLETLARRRYEEGRQEGREEGREEGRQEGREEGRRETVREAIRLRFGAVPPALEQRIAHAGPEDLARLLEQALRAARLDDL
jgi:predicted transposase YdaD